MSSHDAHGDSIGPELDLAGFAIPPAVGERLGTLYGTGDRVRTGADWVAATREALDDVEGRPPSVADLCTTPDGRHAFTGDDEHQEFVCVLDPLLYPFLTGTTGTVRSESPVSNDEIAVEITESGVSTSHPDAVVSIGVADEVGNADEGAADPATDDGPVTPETVYGQVCEYIHVFEDERAYESWAETVPAATTSVPLPTGIALARELAASLFGSERAG